MTLKPVERLDELEYYEQESGPNITYQYIVKPGTMGLLSAGRVRLKGPTEKLLDKHEGWDQVYLVLSGTGSVVVGDRSYPVEGGTVVRVPRGTKHGVILGQEQELEYCYFNAFADAKALSSFMTSL